MPMFDGQLAGDQGRAIAMAIVQDLQQVPALFGVERDQSPVVEHQQVGLGQAGEEFGVAPIAFGDGIA